MNKPAVNIINKINLNKWLKQYKSNNFAKNPKIDLFSFNIYENFKIIILDLHYYNTSYELIKSFNNFFNVEDFEIYDITCSLTDAEGKVGIKVHNKKVELNVEENI